MNEHETVLSQHEALVAAWHIAAIELGVRVVSPFTIHIAESSITFPIHLPDFGGLSGMVCGTLDTPADTAALVARAGYYYSRLNAEIYRSYDRATFIATLDDWQYFGPRASAPEWYSGQSWCGGPEPIRNEPSV